MQNHKILELPNCDHITLTVNEWKQLIIRHWFPLEIFINKKMTPEIFMELYNDKENHDNIDCLFSFNFYSKNQFEIQLGHLFTHETVQIMIENIPEDEYFRTQFTKCFIRFHIFVTMKIVWYI